MLNLSGSPVITGNTAYGQANDVFLNNNTSGVVNIAGKLDPSARIGICEHTITGNAFTQNLPGNGTTDNFVTNHPNTTILLNDDGEAYTVRIYHVTVGSDIEHGTVTADKQTAYAGETVTLTAAPADGYRLSSLRVADIDGRPVEVSDNRFVMPNGNVYVGATFEVIEDETDAPVLGDADGDGAVTIVDATVIRRVLVDLPVRSFNAFAADIDGDGEINIMDATGIQRYLAFCGDPYPIGDAISG